jgi:hypothetical protein
VKARKLIFDNVSCFHLVYCITKLIDCNFSDCNMFTSGTVVSLGSWKDRGAVCNLCCRVTGRRLYTVRTAWCKPLTEGVKLGPQLSL